MTYSGCRFLGLETQWKGNKDGLIVEKTGITAAYLPYASAVTNKGSYQASIPVFPIKVNGNTVDNSKLKYPLLSFRDITYFPMTWEFGVNEFGWDYRFDAKDGLVINSDNVTLAQINFAGKNAKKNNKGIPENATITKTAAYYEDTKGQIVQVSLSEPVKTKTIYQLPIWSYGQGEFVYGNLYVEKGTAYLFYHQGGATMGSDHLIQLNDDGSTAVLQNSYTRSKTFGEKRVSYWTGGAPGPGNLFIAIGDGEPKPIGNPDYLYGWAWVVSADSSGGSGSDDVYLDGEYLYILGFYMNGTKEETNGIYRVNIKTNETVRMSRYEALSFQKEGDYLYYQHQGALYKISLKDGSEEFVRQMVQLPNYAEKFAVLGGIVYWQDGLNHNLYSGEGVNLNFGAALEGVKLSGNIDEYLICTFQETELSKYRIMVFDKAGNVVFKTSDTAQIGDVDIVGKTIYFYNTSTGTACKGILN